MSKYLEFIKDEKGTIVLSKRQNSILGEIRFYQPWKQYVFEPVPNALFNDECLTDIIQQIKSLNTQGATQAKEENDV